MRKLLVGLVFSALMLTPGVAQAQFGLGVEGLWADDFEWGVGARAVFGLHDPAPISFIAQFDYFFPDAAEGTDLTVWEVNLNAAYEFFIEEASINTYLGGGLNVAHVSLDLGAPLGTSDNTEVGFNVIGGIKREAGPVIPFAEVKYELSGGEQFVITVGAVVNLWTPTP
jgi:hypothetical protein